MVEKDNGTEKLLIAERYATIALPIRFHYIEFNEPNVVADIYGLSGKGNDAHNQTKGRMRKDNGYVSLSQM